MEEIKKIIEERIISLEGRTKLFGGMKKELPELKEAMEYIEKCSQELWGKTPGYGLAWDWAKKIISIKKDKEE